MNVASELAKDPQVILYFLALGWSIFASFKRTKYLRQFYVALAFMSLTWLLRLCDGQNEYKQNGEMNLFDDDIRSTLLNRHILG